MNISHINFHDASLDHLYKDGNTVSLEISSVFLDEDPFADPDEKPKSFFLKIYEVNKIERSGDICSNIQMEAEDGEILNLEIINNGINLLVEWHNFENKDFFPVSYQILGKRVEILEKKNSSSKLSYS